MKVKKKIVFGDSHVRPLRFFQSKGFEVCSISGATMSGVVNPNSKTNTREIIRKKLEESSYSDIFLSLGEVDTGFLSLIESKNLADAKTKIDRSVQRYSDFVKDLWEEYNPNNIIIINVCPPIIGDKELSCSKIKMRRGVRFDYYERDIVVRHCNKMIKENFSNVLDAYGEFTRQMGKRKYRHVNKRDHHFDSRFYCSVMAELMSRHNVKLEKTWVDDFRLYVHDVMSFFK